jgi:hypothetical protein
MLSAEEVERRRNEVESKKKIRTERISKKNEKKIQHSGEIGSVFATYLTT